MLTSFISPALNKSPVKQFFLYLPFSLIFLYFVFQSAILIPFAHHDQYHYFLTPKSAYSHDYAFNWVAYALARPVSAIFEDFIFFHTFSLSDLSLFRLLYIGIAGIAMAVLATCLSATGTKKLIAYLISGAIFTLPAIAGLIELANVENMFAILLALFSYIFLMPVNQTFWKLQKTKTIFYLSSASLCLLTSFLIYPTMAYFFLVPIFYIVLFSPITKWPITRNIVVKNLIFLGISSLLFYAIAKLLVLHYYKLSANIPIPPPYTIQIHFSLIKKIKIFWKVLLPDAINLWNIYTNKTIKTLMLMTILSGAIFGIINFKKSQYYLLSKKQVTQYILQVTTVTLLLIIASALFHFVGPNWSFFLFRTLLVLSALLLLLLIWSLKQWLIFFYKIKQEQILTVLVALLCLTGGIVTGINVGKSALNDNMEINYISSEIADHWNDKITRIDIILPYRTDVGFNDLPAKTDEFNIISSSANLDVRGAVNLALSRVTTKNFTLYDCGLYKAVWRNYQRQCLAPAPKDSIIITNSIPADQTPITPNTLTIDMNNLFYLDVMKKPLNKSH